MLSLFFVEKLNLFEAFRGSYDVFALRWAIFCLFMVTFVVKNVRQFDFVADCAVPCMFLAVFLSSHPFYEHFFHFE